MVGIYTFLLFTLIIIFITVSALITLFISSNKQGNLPKEKMIFYILVASSVGIILSIVAVSLILII